MRDAPDSRIISAAVLMLVSTVLFASMHAVVRIASQTIHPLEVVFFRNAFGVIVLLPWLFRHGLGIFRTTRPGLQVTRSLINVVAMGLFFIALSLTPLAQVQALTFTAPVFSMVLAALILREHIDVAQWVALGIAFAGVLVIVQPGVVPVSTGALLVLASSAIWGLTLIVIKVLSRTDSSITITAWMVTLMTLLSAIPAALVWRTPNLRELLILVSAGILGTGAQLLLTEALRRAPASVVMPIDFAKIVWGALIAWLLFGESVTLTTWIGAIMIFATALWLTLRKSGSS